MCGDQKFDRAHKESWGLQVLSQQRGDLRDIREGESYRHISRFHDLRARIALRGVI